ncbi:MAG: hypothetical protein K6T80_05375 [Firmicutes bacterium]|nr:hypothetical protein [Bacillota bacterium]
MPYKVKKEQAADTVGLLISILVRYPEVATINFDPENHLIKFTFIYSQILNVAELENLKTKLYDSIGAYNHLEGKETRFVSVSHQTCDDLTMVEVQRDVDSLVQEEIALIVEILHQYLNTNPVTEVSEQLFEEDLVAQEEFIDHLLETVKYSNQDKYLFAFREEGRVLVFNK